jgi:hypothetical protein
MKHFRDVQTVSVLLEALWSAWKLHLFASLPPNLDADGVHKDRNLFQQVFVESLFSIGSSPSLFISFFFK